MGNCPSWTEDVPSDRAGEFRAVVADVQQRILSLASQRLIEVDDILQCHQTLFERFVPLRIYAGHFRGDEHRCLETDVEVGTIRGAPWQVTAIHVRNLVTKVRRDLTELELNWSRLTARERVYRLSVHIANFVGGFIAIHPFINGNGRISRLLWRWSLYRFGVPAQVAIHPRPPMPYSALMRSAMLGDLRPFVLHILQHLASNPPEVE